jgi:hypothetical protein
MNRRGGTVERAWARVLLAGGALLSPAIASCSKSPIVEERAIVVHAPNACPVAENEAYSLFYAVGDFEPKANPPAAAGVFLRDHGHAMPELPATARAIVVDISQGDLEWRGFSQIDPSGPVDVLVWPDAKSCSLTRDVERRDGATFAVFDQHFMIAGGRAEDGSQVPHTFVGDLATGVITELAVGLATRRSNPSITAFRSTGAADAPSGALIAGGHDPDSDTGGVPLRALSTAEVYVPKVGAPGDVGEFDANRIDLSEPRARHGAVVLASGETLLVGGAGPAGPLRTMEIVDPTTRRARTAGVALLRVARTNPTVLRLANGEVLVAGGVDAEGRPIPTLEWFSPDASLPTKQPVDLVTGVERAFVPLEAGGALAIVRPSTNTTDFKTVWVVSADGTLEPGEALDPSVLDVVRLFPGAGGAPALWTGRRWMRWSPWLARFEPMANAPDSTSPDSPGPQLDRIGSGDPGLSLWLDIRASGTMNVVGFRFATRTAFDLVPKPLLLDGTDLFAPDRSAALAGSSIRFDRELGLVLGAGASAFLTDFTFADFVADLDVTSVAPSVVLRSERGTELEVGGASCPFAQSAHQSLRVNRSGTRVSFSMDGAAERACETALERDARVTLGLRGPQGASFGSAKNLRISRR